MKEQEKVYQNLKEKYTPIELAEAVMVSEPMTKKEEQKAREEFAKLRLEKRKNLSEKERLLSSLLALKYQIKSYINSSTFDSKKSFPAFLNLYLKAIGRKQKMFAEEIGLHPSRLNRILKGKEKIGKSIAYRLENHLGETIPAIYWWKLMQKEIEEEIRTETKERVAERKHVKRVAYRSSGAV